MQDRNIVITGGTDGMGKATAHQLAKMGARLLLVGRTRARGEAAVADIVRDSGNDGVTFLQADLSLMRNVRMTVDHVREEFDRLDGIVHAAGGVFPRERTLTDEGLELCFALQNMARFVLTNELIDLLRAAPAPKVVTLGGGGTQSMPGAADDFQAEEDYSWSAAVSRVGAINDMLTLEQAARYDGITFYNYGPGIVRTKIIMQYLPMRLLFSTIGRPFSRSPEQAATDIVTLITGDYPGGFYRPSLKRNEPPKTTVDGASHLWDYSEELIDSLLPDGSPDSVDHDLLEPQVN